MEMVSGQIAAASISRAGREPGNWRWEAAAMARPPARLGGLVLPPPVDDPEQPLGLPHAVLDDLAAALVLVADGADGLAPDPGAVPPPGVALDDRVVDPPARRQSPLDRGPMERPEDL